MRKPGIFSDKYLLAIILIAIIYAGYWLNYGAYLYSHFLSGYYDIGVAAYTTLWHFQGFGTSFLQYLVNGNHIAPFLVTVVAPLFMISPQPVTLLAIQDATLALTAIILYLVSSELIKSRKVGFAIALAFLVNPGTTGLFFFDFHLEAFIPIFVILSFYFYMKRNRIGFLVSYVCLLSVMETAPLVGGSLIVGLLFYERFHGLKSAKPASRDLRPLWCGLALTFVALAAYYLIGSALASYYASTPYSTLSPLLWYGNELSAFGQSGVASHLIGGAGSWSWIYVIPAFVGLMVLFLSMGFSMFADPILSLILLSPWLLLAFVVQLHGPDSSSFFHQYYSYAIGGAAVAVILGYMIAKEKRPLSKRLANLLNVEKNGAFLQSYTVIVSLAMMVLLSPLPVSVIAPTIYHPPNVTAVNTVISMIPQNASVMAESTIMAHLYRMRDIELLDLPSSSPVTPADLINSLVYWFNPEYVVYTDNTSYYFHTRAPSHAQLIEALDNYTGSNYSMIYNTSGVILLKRT